MKVVVALVALLLCCTGSKAQRLVALGTFGAWNVVGGIASDGKRMCSISSQGTLRRSFHMKYFEGDSAIVLHIFKDGWKIPDGTRVSVVLAVDRAEPWSAVATGYGNMVEFTMDTNAGELVNFLRNGRELVIYFPDGSEPPLPISLRGSTAAMVRLVECMDKVDGTRAPTQPHAAPTQPFRAPPTSPSAQPTIPVDRPKSFLVE